MCMNIVKRQGNGHKGGLYYFQLLVLLADGFAPVLEYYTVESGPIEAETEGSLIVVFKIYEGTMSVQVKETEKQPSDQIFHVSVKIKTL